MLVYGVVVAVMAVLLIRMPTGFFPAEDQGGLFTPITLPVGAMQSRTLEVAKQVEHFYLVDEKENVHSIFIVAGFSFAGQGQNTGQAFVNLDRLGRTARRREQRTGDRRARDEDVLEAFATRRSFRCCRRRCANSATPPVSRCSSRIAAISATTR